MSAWPSGKGTQLFNWPGDGGTKVCSNGPGHMTKLATTPIYGKNLKKIFFSGTKRLMTLKLDMQHWVLEYFQVFLQTRPEFP